jgi:hypothetical protein
LVAAIATPIVPTRQLLRQKRRIFIGLSSINQISASQLAISLFYSGDKPGRWRQLGLNATLKEGQT